MKLIPITKLFLSINGPPLLPWLIGVSICKNILWIPLIIPFVIFKLILLSSDKWNPTAITFSFCSILSESPNSKYFLFLYFFILNNAISKSKQINNTSASKLSWPSVRIIISTLTESSITW